MQETKSSFESMVFMKNSKLRPVFFLGIIAGIWYLYSGWTNGEFYFKGASVNRDDKPFMYFMALLVNSVFVIYLSWLIIFVKNDDSCEK